MKKITITNWISKPMLYSLLLTFIVSAFVAGTCIAQENDKYNLSELDGLFHYHKHETPKYSGKSDKPKNEMEFIMATGFNTYKKFFSSQDNPSCVFHPSCSSYSVQALQQKGLIIGTFQTFDRLSRCHRFIKTNQYIYDPSKQRFYDPVK